MHLFILELIVHLSIFFLNLNHRPNPSTEVPRTFIIILTSLAMKHLSGYRFRSYKLITCIQRVSRNLSSQTHTMMVKTQALVIPASLSLGMKMLNNREYQKEKDYSPDSANSEYLYTSWGEYNCPRPKIRRPFRQRYLVNCSRGTKYWLILPITGLAESALST